MSLSHDVMKLSCDSHVIGWTWEWWYASLSITPSNSLQLLSIELWSEEAELATPPTSWSSCCKLVAPDDVMEVGDTDPSRVEELTSSPAIEVHIYTTTKKHPFLLQILYISNATNMDIYSLNIINVDILRIWISCATNGGFARGKLVVIY